MYIYDEKVGRRKFIKTAVMAAGAVAIGVPIPALGSANEQTLKTNPERMKEWGREAGKWIPSCCNMCGGQSGILVHVVNGVVEKIEPNNWNPNNYSNISSDFFNGYTEEYGCKDGGVICPKGNAGIMQLYDPDRVKKPLKRTNPNKGVNVNPGFVEISWEQALSEISAKLKNLRDVNEAHKLLWFSEDHSFTHIQDDFLKLYGSPNYSMHSNLCDVARKASFKAVMGEDRPLADFSQSKYILLFGWNPTSAIKWVHLPRMLVKGLENGAKLTIVDPYLSDTAAKATEWVPIRPSTDGALALALGHVIVRDKLYNNNFVKNWTVGFKEYSEYVKDKTPEWAEKITTVPAKTIERIAREFATTQPSCVDVWSGPGQHSNGVQGGRAIACLAALTGGFDRPGTLIIPDKRGNKHAEVKPDSVAEKTLKNKRFDEIEKYPLGHKSGVYTQSFENLANSKGPYRPKMAFIVFQNPMMSVPGSQTVAKALAKPETVVVIDTMKSETAMFADYLLPGTTYLERYDLNTHWVTWPALGLRQPVVKPIFGQLTEYEIVASLGRRLGLKDKDGKELFKTGALSGKLIEDLTEWYEDYLSNELKKGEPKMTLAELKNMPGAVWVDKKGTKYKKYNDELPEEKLKTAFFDGDKEKDGTTIYDKPKDQKGKRIGTIFDGMPLRGFLTPSGKVEFYAKSLASKKDRNGKAVDPLPVYEPRDWQPSKEYPLYSINWKEASHTHTRTQNNAWLLEIKPENPLIIHPDTAAKFKVKDGDTVLIKSPYGSTKAKIKVSKRIHPEVVGLQHGFGHSALGNMAKGRGTSDALLRPTKSDPLSGQALHKENCVMIYKA